VADTVDGVEGGTTTAFNARNERWRDFSDYNQADHLTRMARSYFASVAVSDIEARGLDKDQLKSLVIHRMAILVNGGFR